MNDPSFQLVAIPLNRSENIRFLQSVVPGMSRGQSLLIVGQRPTPETELAWLKHLQTAAEPHVKDLLVIDDPHGHLVETTTERLVPLEKLKDPQFLRLNLGGWTPIYFAVIGLNKNQSRSADPLLRRAEILADYGDRIRFFGADPLQVEARLARETGLSNVRELARLLGQVRQMQPTMANEVLTAYADRLYAETRAAHLAAHGGRKGVPELLLFDALLSEMVRLENARREAVADGNEERARSIAAWQQKKEQDTGLRLLLKGEYIVGRARRSTVLIAPELGVVIKQPGPEPFHEIELGARIYRQTAENWPFLTSDGALVTPRGRLRLIVEEDILPRIARVLGHRLTLSTLMGLTVESYIPGETVQQHVLSRPERMTAALYEEFVLQQQVCELLGIENGDWHSANFMYHPADGRLVHVDWGAARPLRPDERTPQGRLARLNQMKNIAFSFHNQPLAEKVLYLHEELIGDGARLSRIGGRARALVEAAK